MGLSEEPPDEVENVAAIARRVNMTWPVGVGAENSIAALNVETYPTLIVFGRDGRVVGSTNWTSDLGPIIDRALAQ